MFDFYKGQIQDLENLLSAIGEMLSEVANNNHKEWEKKDTNLAVWKRGIEEAKITVVKARVRCTCCKEVTSEVYVYQRESSGTLQAGAEQLNHKDTIFEDTFEGCINTEGGGCEIRILDDIWFAPDESMEVGDGYALNEDTSYMVCLTGYGMIYISDSGQVIKSMEDDMVDELLDRLINHDAFMDMGWSSDFESTYKEGKDDKYDIYDELKKYMKKYGIVNSVSIAMFLATMKAETGGGAEKLEKYKKNDDYTANVRGAGLIQITGADQREFLNDILKTLSENDPRKTDIENYIKYYSEDGRDNTYTDLNGRTAAEFIADEFPVESATWYWAAYPKIGKSSINDCVVKHAQDNRYNTFAVTQMAVNGNAYGGEVLDRFCSNINNCVMVHTPKGKEECTEPKSHTKGKFTDYCFTLEEDEGRNDGDTHRHDYGPWGWENRLAAYEATVGYMNQP